MVCSRKLKLTAKLSAFEERLRQRADAVDGFSCRVEDARKTVAAHASRCADRQVRKELRARHANLRVGSDEGRFCLLNIRPPLEQLRRQTGGKILRRRRKRIGITVSDGSGILTKQKSNCIFLLLNLLFELRYLRGRRVEQLFRLAHIG